MARDFSRFPELRAAALPAEDQGVLRSLSPNELPAWIDARAEELQRRIGELQRRIGELQRRIGELVTHVATLQHLRNTQCVPVSHLPNEVLMRVFGDSSLAVYGNSIRGVCRLWRSVLLDSTSFWANYISTTRFGNSDSSDSDDLKSERMLHVALLHSGVLPISLHTADPDIRMFRVLDTFRGRIAKWTVHLSEFIPTSVLSEFIHSGSMTCLHTLSVQSDSDDDHGAPQTLDWDTSNLPALRSLDISGWKVTPSIMVGSLESLELYCEQLTHHSLVDILKRCPILTRLWLGGRTLKREQQDSHSASPTVDLPLLRQLTVGGLDSTDVDPFLRLFGSIPEHALVELSIMEVSTEDLEYYQLCRISSLPSINRLYIKSSSYYGDDLTLGGYVDSDARLRIQYSDFVGLAKALQPFLACPLIVLVIDVIGARPQSIRKHYGHIFTLELPHLRRLELPHRVSRAAKQTVTELFLGRYSTRASELSLAWAFSIYPKQEAQTLAAEEVEGLLTVLREHVRCGNPRLGRLELYAVEEKEPWRPKEFSGDIEADSDVRTCSQVVEPFLAELRGLVDEVHIG